MTIRIKAKPGEGAEQPGAFPSLSLLFPCFGPTQWLHIPQHCPFVAPPEALEGAARPCRP
jgi:hypothetical protein